MKHLPAESLAKMYFYKWKFILNFSALPVFWNSVESVFMGKLRKVSINRKCKKKGVSINSFLIVYVMSAKTLSWSWFRLFCTTLWRRHCRLLSNLAWCFPFLLKISPSNFTQSSLMQLKPLLLTIFNEDKENVLLPFSLMVFSAYLEMIILFSFGLLVSRLNSLSSFRDYTDFIMSGCHFWNLNKLNICIVILGWPNRVFKM